MQAAYEAVRAPEYDSVDKASGPDALIGLLDRLSGNSAGENGTDRYSLQPVSSDLEDDELHEAVEKANALPNLLARLSVGTPADVGGKERYRLTPVHSDLTETELHDAVVKRAVANDPVLRDQSGQKVGDLIGGLFIWPEAEEHKGQHVPADSPWAGVRWEPSAWQDGNPPALLIGPDGLRAAP